MKDNWFRKNIDLFKRDIALLFLCGIIGILLLIKLTGISVLVDNLYNYFDNKKTINTIVSIVIVASFVFWKYVKTLVRIGLIFAAFAGILTILNNTPVLFYMDDMKDYFFMDEWFQSETKTGSVQPQADHKESSFIAENNALMQANKELRENIRTLTEQIHLLQSQTNNQNPDIPDMFTKGWTYTNREEGYTVTFKPK